MFAIEHYGIQPDILTGAKALGNGFPIGFFSTTDAIASAFTRPSASTLGGNPVSCTAGLGVLAFIREEGLVEQAREKGEFLRAGLNALAAASPILGEPRGLGLMIGLPVIPAEGSDGAVLTDLILEGMKDRGFLIGKNGTGRDVLAFQPPLVVSLEEIKMMLAALKTTIEEVE